VFLNYKNSYILMLNELCSCIRFIYRCWSEYEEILDIGSTHGIATSVSYRPSTSTLTFGVGRPRFDIDKDQLEYLDLNGLKLQYYWE